MGPDDIDAKTDIILPPFVDTKGIIIQTDVLIRQFYREWAAEESA